MRRFYHLLSYVYLYFYVYVFFFLIICDKALFGNRQF